MVGNKLQTIKNIYTKVNKKNIKSSRIKHGQRKTFPENYKPMKV